MKFHNIILLCIVFTLMCQFNKSTAEDGGAAKRLALRRPTGGKIGKPSSTTTSPPASNDDEEGDYGDGEQDHQYADENEEAVASSTTTTTTETPKRIGPVIRPFRSNDDFLNSLKRRQMNAKKHKSEKPVAKEGGNLAQDTQEAEASTKTFSKPSSTANRNRKFNKTAKSEAEDNAAEETEPEQKEDGKSAGKRPAAGRLALKKRN